MGISLYVIFCLKEACDLVEHSHHPFGVVFVIFFSCCVVFVATVTMKLVL